MLDIERERIKNSNILNKSITMGEVTLRGRTITVSEDQEALILVLKDLQDAIIRLAGRIHG